MNHALTDSEDITRQFNTLYNDLFMGQAVVLRRPQGMLFPQGAELQQRSLVRMME
jgi:hypothetical protein